MEKIPAIILARGGSKRLPRKNMQLFQGKPLVRVAIECALGAKRVDRIILSTDDEQIAAVGGELGCDVIKRPAELSGDGARSEDAVVHAMLGVYDRYKMPAYGVLLQPTSPLRRSIHVDRALSGYLKKKRFATVVSVVKCHLRARYEMRRGKLLRVESLLQPHEDNGAIYGFSTKSIVETLRLDLQEYPVMSYPMAPEDSIDIDTQFDLDLANWIASRK
jgi:CMP-N-acetylneuraminic acid synthetase